MILNLKFFSSLTTCSLQPAVVPLQHCWSLVQGCLTTVQSDAKLAYITNKYSYMEAWDGNLSPFYEIITDTPTNRWTFRGHREVIHQVIVERLIKILFCLWQSWSLHLLPTMSSSIKSPLNQSWVVVRHPNLDTLLLYAMLPNIHNSFSQPSVFIKSISIRDVHSHSVHIIFTVWFYLLSILYYHVTNIHYYIVFYPAKSVCL